MSRFERERLPQVADEIHRRAVASEIARLGIKTPGEDWDALDAAVRTPEARILLGGSMLNCVEFEGTTKFGNILGKRGNRLNSMWPTAASERHFSSERSIRPNARQIVVHNGDDFAHVFLVPGHAPAAMSDYHYQRALSRAGVDSLYSEEYVLKTAAKFDEGVVIPLSEPTAAEMNAALESEAFWIAQAQPEEAA